MLTSTALAPAVAMVTLGYGSLVVIMILMGLSDTSPAAQHFLGHAINVVVMSVNGAFAIVLLTKHKDLRATIVTVLQKFCGNPIKVVKVTPMEMTDKNDEARIRGNTEGELYYKSLAAAWDM